MAWSSPSQLCTDPGDRRRHDGRSDEHAQLSPNTLMRFIAQMRQDPAAEFKTEAVAARFDVAAAAFIRAFKRLTGLSPLRFRAALRIELAKRLLVETDRPVTDVSLDVGYDSLGTFVRTFHLLVGISPTQLRRLAMGHGTDNILADWEPTPARHSSGFLRATVVRPQGTGPIAAGLFPQSVPAGLPIDGCFVNPAAPCFRLAWPDGRSQASLLIAAIGSFTIQSAWAGRLTDLQVASIRLPASACAACKPPIRLHLRPLTDCDPPFLTPIPLLMILQSRRSATAANPP